MLVWEPHHNYPMILAKSSTAKGGAFRIFYDDVMYWDSFSNLSPTQDLEAIKMIAQQIHDQGIVTRGTA